MVSFAPICKRLLACCKRADVFKGLGGVLSDSFCGWTMNLCWWDAERERKSQTSVSVSNSFWSSNIKFCGKKHAWTRCFCRTASALTFACISFSYTRRSAGVWHRPADNAFWLFLNTYFHKSGEMVNPTNKSSTCRACCARTMFILMVTGFSTALSNAGLVTSWNKMRRVLNTGKSNTSQICHAIASPSLSWSVAKRIFSLGNVEMTDSIFEIWAFLSGSTVYKVSKSPLTWMFFKSLIIRMWPLHEMHL